MWLDCGHHGAVQLNRIAERFVFSAEPREIPPCFADLNVTVDGKLSSVRVNLTNGFQKGRYAARALRVDDSAPF